MEKNNKAFKILFIFIAIYIVFHIIKYIWYRELFALYSHLIQSN